MWLSCFISRLKSLINCLGLFDFWFLISSFIFTYSFSTFFIKANSSCLMFESIKPLESKTSMWFSLAFGKNTILSCFLLFFLIIDLYFLIPAVIVQTFNPVVELVILIAILSRELKKAIEIYPVTAKAKMRKCLV